MNLDLTTIGGIIAIVLSVLLGTGKLDLKAILEKLAAFLQKKPVTDVANPIVTDDPITKEEANSACMTLIEYAMVNDLNVDEIVSFSKEVMSKVEESE